MSLESGSERALVGLAHSKTACESKWEQQNLNDGLVHASFLGNIPLVQWFLFRNAQVEYWQDPVYDDSCSMEQHTFKSSAILAACQQGHLDVVICLHKSVTQSKDASSRDGLCNCNYWAILVETLKNRNQIMGKCTIQDDEGHNIDLDVDPFLHPFYFLENIPLLKYLIDSGADLSAKGQSGKTPLMKAAASPRYAQALELLLQGGADPNTLSRQHYSALVCAARKRNVTAMRKLLEYGACLEQLTQEFRLTDADDAKVLGKACHALVFCVALGYLPEAQLLIEWGARPSMIPQFLLYILHFLDQTDLRRYTDCISYLHLAFYQCQPEMVRYLLEVNFLSPRDVLKLRHDKDLHRHLMNECEEEEEMERDLASVDINMNVSRNLAQRHSGPVAPSSNASTDRSALPACTTLSLFNEFSHNPPTLFMLCVMKVRQAHGTDAWVQGTDGAVQAQSSLGLPKPLIKSILYANTWLSH